MESTLNYCQELRFALAHALDFNIEKAQTVYNFIIGENTVDTKTTPEAPSSYKRDGVYYVLDDGTLTDLSNTHLKDRIVGVAVKHQDHIATVALHDAADGEEIALVADENDYECGTPQFFHSNFWDAITDWDGEANTKDYGDKLNPEIGLKPGQYIPSLAQLHLILLNIKEVNKALEAIGGTPMRKEWYWSSTENSAYYSWTVSFGNGGSNYYVKCNTYVVRPAVACQL